MSLLRTLTDRVVDAVAISSPSRSETEASRARHLDDVNRWGEEVASHLSHRRWLPAPPRPDVIVGQSLRAAMVYRADRGWLDHPKPLVMSTAPFDGFPGRVLLVITDPPTLDPDVWRQLRGRDDLTCVVRP